MGRQLPNLRGLTPRLTAAACIVAAAALLNTAYAQTPDAWKPGLSWAEGLLVIDIAEPHESVRAIVDLVNAGEFDAALAAIPSVAGPLADQRRAELALAIAGHLDVFSADEALAAAEKHIAAGLAKEPESIALLRMRNQLEIYKTVPWLGMPTDPVLLPSRDLIADGRVDEGRKKIADAKNRAVLNSFCIAGFFQRQEPLAVLVDDAEKMAADAENEEFVGLIQSYRQHEWASLSVQPDHLLYPRVLLGRMRAYYWWWRQMGERYRPMSKQGFFELLEEITGYFPNHDTVRMYRGERVPWGEGFRPDPVPEGAPEWAVNQCELRARVDCIVEWWFENRQAPNGELGGGWEDDCETLRRWAITSICVGNPKIEAGIKRLVDGIWTSGQLVNGYDKAFKDVEHSSEMAADTSVMMALAYGDPLYFERFLETTRTTEEVHTAVNEYGHRHFKAMKMSATAVSDQTRHSVDAMYCGRAMRPAGMVAWYSAIPRAVTLMHEWAKAWNEDTLRAGETKPAGVMPAVIGFAEDNVDGPTDKWYDPSLGDLYDWRAGRQDMVMGKILGAWMLTGDDTLLNGIRAQFEILRKYKQNPVKDPAAGSLDWAGKGLVSETNRLAGLYRGYTGDPQFDDIVRTNARGYARFLATGEPRHASADHAGELNAMRVNLPMVTSEVRGTDRVALMSMSLLGPLTGSPVSITEPPSFAVTWRNVSPGFTALVRRSNATNINTWVYSFDDQPLRPTIRFWRLDPGRYSLRIGVDADSDGEPDNGFSQVAEFSYRERLDAAQFDLPPRTLCLLDVTQIEPGAERAARLPDLALSQVDLQLKQAPVAGRPCKGEVTVHNIGSADANGIRVTVLAGPAAGDAELTPVADLEIDALAFPADLVAKRATLGFSWTPTVAGTHRLAAVVSTEGNVDEVCSRNNRITVAVDVARP